MIEEATYPAGQSNSSAKREGQKWPRGQSVHVACPPTEYCPVIQSVRVPDVVHPFPAGHRKQVLNEELKTSEEESND